MKITTAKKMSQYLKENKIVYHDKKPLVDYYLSNGEIRDLIRNEYGINSRKKRTQKKYA